MKILFTKTQLDQTGIKSYFGERVHCHFLDVISTKTIKIQPFPVDGKALIFTSVNGVKAFHENKFVLNPHQSIFCVGEKTTRQLHKHGYTVRETAGNAAELAEILIEKYNKNHFLHFCGNIALETIGEKLSKKKIPYQKVVIYETLPLNPEITEKFDAVAFFSPSGVRSFANQNSFSGRRFFSIGKTTEDEINKYTSEPVITSKENTLEDLLTLMKEHLHRA